MANDYSFPLERFGGQERLDRLMSLTAGMETPVLAMDLDIVESQYNRLRKALPLAEVFYAVKANPMPEVVKLLVELGSNFDIASRYELDHVLSLGAQPSKVSYGNTIKKPADIAYAYGRGVRLFACDAEDDARKISTHAPGSKVFFRVFNQGTGSDWPLSRKFGAHPDMIWDIARVARDGGLIPYGISFHVGSQQRDIGEWGDALARVASLFSELKEEGINLEMVNLGGGLPANYLDPSRPVEVYCEEINKYLEDRFGDEMPRILVEPGRYLVGDAGVLISEIVLATKKAHNNIYRWVYVDAGMFGGLIETVGESIKYPIYFPGEGEAEEIIIAGPTCDSMDILYEHHKYTMPTTLRAGDRMYVLTAGAYTLSYSSVAFNGFPPLKAAVLPRQKPAAN